MSIKWIGAIVVILCCGWFGYTFAAAHRMEEKCLSQLIGALDYMGCELQYRLTPLPELCAMTAAYGKGVVSSVFKALSDDLNSQISPDVPSCMASVVSQCRDLPPHTKECLLQFGNSLGQFDLQGQLIGLESVRQAARQKLQALRQNKDIRLRSYQTLGLCAGAAIAILFI